MPVTPAPDAGSGNTPVPKKRAPAKKTAHHKTSGGGGGGGGGGNASGGHGTPAWFAHQVLAQLGLPTTQANINWMVAWESREGGHWENSATYNPLNTTLAMPGSGTMNSVGVRSYTSWQQGIEATAKTLASGLYSDIRGALSTGHVSLDQHFQSLMSWSGNGYDNVSGGSVHYNPTGGGGGGGGGGATAAISGGKVSVQTYLNNPDVLSQFGYLTAYLNDPEVGPILRQAAAQGRSEGWLQSKLANTNWWKTTSQTAREMQALQRVDPASYKQQWKQEHDQAAALATSMGINIDPKRLRSLTTTALFSNWSQQQLQEAVGAEFHYDPNAKYTGTAGATVQKFKAMAGDYLVPLSNQNVGQWTRQALEGKINPDDYSGYLAEQAKTLFPWMAKSIDKGVTPGQYLQPYQSAAASTLELDPAKIDFTQAKWRRLFETVDPKTGERAERGLANAMTLMRTDPSFGYDFTSGAKQEAAGLAQQLAQSFGFAAS